MTKKQKSVLWIYMICHEIAAVIATSTLPSPIISKKCEETGFCTKVSNYPTELVKKLLEEGRKNDNPLLQLLDSDIPVPSGEIEMRSLFYSEKKSLCNSKTLYEYPESAKDMDGVSKFILNHPNERMQQFRTETCSKTNVSCSSEISFAANYRGACIQKMTLREMVYIDENAKFKVGHFQVPTCCSCSLFLNDNK